jgi:ABC-type sugar transport system permease subunit/ABC-type glycerol-3-phosphate transport system substrate-binding protein
MRTLAASLLALITVRLASAVELDIPVFAGGYGTEFYVRSAREFERLRPGVQVHVYGDPRVQDQVQVRVMDGHFPDAACVVYVQWPQLIQAGKVKDLTAELAGPNWEGDAPWGSTFLPGALENWQIGRGTYGLPVSYSCWTLFYNKRLFREHGWTIPQTWDEFFTLCAQIRAAGLAPLSVPGTRWLYADAFFRAAFYNLAGPSGWNAVNDLAPGARLDPRYLRAAALEQRVLQSAALRGWEGESHTGAELSFLEGRAVMTVSGSWLTNEMAGKIPADFELGAMNFPVFPDGVADPSTIQMGADSFFVFATGDPVRERLTIDFLRFLTSRAQAAAFVRTFDSPSAVRGIPLSAYSPQMRDTAEIIARARAAFPMHQLMLQPPAVRQAIVDESERLTLGEITPLEFGRRMEAAAAQDRAQAVDPEHLDYEHPLAGTLLLAGVALLLGILGAGAVARRRAAGAGGAALARRAQFAHLRPGVAAAFVGPALALYAALVVGPGLTALSWAFTRWNGVSPRTWVGLFNFKFLLFGNDVFWLALRHNLFLMVVPALLVVPLALGCAALIHRGVWGGRVFRVVFLFPNLLGGIAATLIWMSAYEPHGGLVNAGISAAGRTLHSAWLAGFDGFPWLAPEYLYTALIPIYVWMACGFNLILYLAAMEGIDPQLYEAAALDGASAWRQFFLITLPSIREVLVISAVFLVISGLNAFEMIWLLTSQFPSSSTHTLGTLLVTAMFQDMDIGRATALAVILFVLVATGSAVVLRLLRPAEAEA